MVATYVLLMCSGSCISRKGMIKTFSVIRIQWRKGKEKLGRYKKVIPWKLIVEVSWNNIRRGMERRSLF
jgi:hypothetical protein